MKWPTKTALSAGLMVILITSCGQKVCVMGLGSCDGTAGVKPGTTIQDSSSRPTIKGSDTTVGPAGKLTFTVSGGTSPYKFSLAGGEYGKLSVESDTTVAMVMNPVACPPGRLSFYVRVTDKNGSGYSDDAPVKYIDPNCLR